MPAQDAARWTPLFRAAAPSQAALFTARALLEPPVAVEALVERFVTERWIRAPLRRLAVAGGPKTTSPTSFRG